MATECSLGRARVLAGLDRAVEVVTIPVADVGLAELGLWSGTCVCLADDVGAERDLTQIRE